MAQSTGISWTDSTFNPWIGCSKVSPGCYHCYGEASTPSRTMAIMWGPNEARKRTGVANWNLPRRWNAGHATFVAQHGRRQRVFCASLAALSGVNWVIVGGESGPHARPMEQDWVESLRTQCQLAHVAFFFKQWGGTTKDKGGCELASGESKEWPMAE
jgi:protein gp37